MERAKEELARIKDELRKNPRGMNVTEIAKALGLNRVTAARYLDLLMLTGYVDLKECGPSKVYFLSQRMPVSAMLSLSSDFIIVLDKDFNIINANGKFLEFTGMSREELYFKKIQIFATSTGFKPSFIPRIKEAIDGTEIALESKYERCGKTHYVNVKLIPIVFEDGNKGVTILIEDITERKLSEQAIRASEEKLRSVIEQSLDGIMLIDNDGTIIEYSKGAEYITGFKPENNVGKKVWETEFISHVTGEYNSDYTTEAGLNNLKKFILAYLRTGVSPLGISSFELTFTRPDNEKRVVLFNYSPIKSENGNMLCTIARDITDRKKAEEVQIKKDSKFRTILDMSPVPMIVSDGMGDKTLYLNAKFTETFGYTINDMPGAYEWFPLAFPDKNYRDYILKNWTILFDRAIKNKTTFTTNKAIIRCKDGSKRVVVASISPIDDMIVIVLYDITERHQVEERYRNMVESASDILWETGENLVFTYINPQAHEILGWNIEEAIGNTPLDYMTPDEAIRFSRTILPYVSARKPFSRLIFKFVKSNGGSSSSTMEVSGTPIFNINGEYTGYHGVARDISAIK